MVWYLFDGSYKKKQNCFSIQVSLWERGGLEELADVQYITNADSEASHSIVEVTWTWKLSEVLPSITFDDWYQSLDYEVECLLYLHKSILLQLHS